MKTLAQNYGDSAYSHKPTGGENFSPTHWSKRKIVSNDNLMKLQKLISLDNVNANDEINIQDAKCECQAKCQQGCTDCCVSDCYHEYNENSCLPFWETEL